MALKCLPGMRSEAATAPGSKEIIFGLNSIPQPAERKRKAAEHILLLNKLPSITSSGCLTRLCSESSTRNSLEKILVSGSYTWINWGENPEQINLWLNLVGSEVKGEQSCLNLFPSLFHRESCCNFVPQPRVRFSQSLLLALAVKAAQSWCFKGGLLTNCK